MPQVIQTFYTRLRHEGDPYLGLVESAKRIIDEEGVMALYRCVVDNSPCGTGQYIRMITNFFCFELRHFRSSLDGLTISISLNGEQHSSNQLLRFRGRQHGKKQFGYSKTHL